MIEFVLQKYMRMAQDTFRFSQTINDDIVRTIYAERLMLVNQFIYDLRRLQAAQTVIESLGEGGSEQ